MSRDVSNADSSDVLNSSFYSSTSINTLDHAKNFRNSLVFSDLSEAGYSIMPPSQSSCDEKGNDYTCTEPTVRDREITTMKMSTSPSLSALAGILNEKSRQANEKLRLSKIIDSSIVEEEEIAAEPHRIFESQEETNTVLATGESSPNLVDINDNDEVYYPRIRNPSNPFLAAQPDFLSTPKITGNNISHTSAASQEEPAVESRRVVSEVNNPEENTKRKHQRPAAQRTVSAGVATDLNSHNKKKKNFFSFLKKRHSGEASMTNGGKQGLPTSTTFSLGSTTSSPLSPDKLTKKSYSSSNLFSTFKKNKEVKKEHESQMEDSANAIPSTAMRENSTANKQSHKHIKKDVPKKDISKRKPTPLSYEHLQTNHEQPPSEICEVSQNKEIPEVESLLALPPKLDTGEVLFPKSLDKQEVDSIVSLERSRSTKSNKRSSVASHRRSLTETLSVNAQNEGMFIMEASSVVLSTPDLGKSPVSSILRSGKFDSADFSSSNSLFHEDLNEKLMADEPSNEPFLNLELSEEPNAMGSIEEKLDKLTINLEEELHPEKREPRGKFDEDPELMSDIMEFASIINFGDGINFDFESNTLEPTFTTLEPHSTANREKQEIEDTQCNGPVQDKGLGITCGDAINDKKHEDKQELAAKLAIEQVEEDEFENEDFNVLSTSPQETPRLKAYIPDFEVNRPLSMSFRGLKAPSFNASITGSSATESLVREDRMSFPGAEKKHFNIVNFSSKIILYDTYGEEEYDRRPEIATCNQLTPQLAQLIKAELNELKSEMEIHEESRCYTHFF